MTYAKQLQDYEDQVMEKRFEEMTDAERENLLEEVEENTKRRVDGWNHSIVAHPCICKDLCIVLDQFEMNHTYPHYVQVIRWTIVVPYCGLQSAGHELAVPTNETIAMLSIIKSEEL